jgi:hypothetical protein
MVRKGRRDDVITRDHFIFPQTVGRVRHGRLNSVPCRRGGGGGGVLKKRDW